MWWKSTENWHILVKQFHGNFRSKTLCCRKIRSVFRDVKWCFNASWGLEGLTSLISLYPEPVSFVWHLKKYNSSSTILRFKFIVIPGRGYIWKIVNSKWEDSNCFIFFAYRSVWYRHVTFWCWTVVMITCDFRDVMWGGLDLTRVKQRHPAIKSEWPVAPTCDIPGGSTRGCPLPGGLGLQKDLPSGRNHGTPLSSRNINPLNALNKHWYREKFLSCELLIVGGLLGCWLVSINFIGHFSWNLVLILITPCHFSLIWGGLCCNCQLQVNEKYSYV